MAVVGSSNRQPPPQPKNMVPYMAEGILEAVIVWSVKCSCTRMRVGVRSQNHMTILTMVAHVCSPSFGTVGTEGAPGLASQPV